MYQCARQLQHSDLTPRELGLQVLGFKQAASPPPLPESISGPAPSSAPSGLSSAEAEGVREPHGPPSADAGTRVRSSNGAGSTAGTSRQRQPAVLVATDSSLRALGRDSLPLGVVVAVQYDLPSNKDTYLRRVTASFGGARERKGGRCGVVVDFVVAGLVDAFRELEGFSLAPVQEMPVQVHDMFL